MRLAEIYRLRESGMPADALREVQASLESIMAADGEMWRQLMHLGGNCLLDLNRPEESERWFSKVWEAMKDPMALSNRGYAKRKQGRSEAALQDYRLAISLQGPSDNLEIDLRSIAQLSLETGDPLAALKYLNECERRYGDSSKIRSLRRRIENYCAS